MESFSLLKYWKSNGGGSGSGGGVNSKLSATTPTTVLTSVSHFESDGEGDGDGDDDGPFFDLEFPVSIADGEHQDEDKRQKVESEFAPLAEMEEIISSATGDKSSQLTLPISLLKSATKLRILMLAGLKRSKSETKQLPIENCQDSKTQNNNNNNNSSKFTTVRLKMEDMKMPKLSILTRTPSNVVNNSSDVDEKLVSDSSSSDNKKERYLRLVRPLYVKVPRNKTNCEDEDDTVEVAEVKSCKTKLSLKVMAKKHLGKSKSSVVHSMPRSNGNNSRNSNSNKSTSLSNKIDDSLLQQQDGIQSAILHCKRSFNSSSSSEDGEDTMSILLRSASDPSYEKKFTLEAAEVEEEDE